MGSQADQVVLDFVREYLSRTPHSPTYREIADGTGYSTRTVYVAVRRLMEEGHLTASPGLHRSVRLPDGLVGE